MQQVLIASKSIVNKSKQGIQTLVENLILPPLKSFHQPASKSRLQGRLRKKPHIENKVEQEGFVEVEASNKSTIRTESSHNQIQKSRIDPGRTSG